MTGYSHGEAGRQRAFRVDAPADEGLLARVGEARSRGAVPDVIVGGVLVGDGPIEALDLVDVAPDELRQLVDAVNQVGATPSSLIAILEALKSSGSLRAELVVI